MNSNLLKTVLRLILEFLFPDIALRSIPENSIPTLYCKSFGHFGQNYVIIMCHNCLPSNVGF